MNDYAARALLVDLDGTLVDSEPALFACYRRFLAEHDAASSRDEFELLVGPTLPEIVDILRSRHDFQDSRAALELRYRRILSEDYVRRVRLRPGARFVLEQARASGTTSMVVTSASREVTEPVLHSTGITDLVDGWVTADGLDRGKPDPAIYERALERAAVEPADAVAIEDSAAGLRSALAAHIPTVQVGDRPREAAGDGDPLFLGGVADLVEAWNIARRPQP